MADNPEAAYGKLIGGLRAQLSVAIASSNEEPIRVDGGAVDYLVYSHAPGDRHRGYLALVAALGTSPNRARYGLLAYATDENYRDVALDEIGRSFEAERAAKEAAGGLAVPIVVEAVSQEAAGFPEAEA